MFNKRVWRHFLAKIFKVLVILVACFGYAVILTAAGIVTARVFSIPEAAGLLIVTVAGVLVPLILWILIQEFRESRRAIEHENQDILQKLKHGG